MGLIHNRLRVVAGRLERMMARFAAGRAMSRPARAVVAGDAGVVAASGRKPVERYWPVKFGWLLDLKQHDAAWFTSNVDRFLREPEMVGLLIASKQARKLLRPMCFMLGVDLALLRPRAPDEVVVAKVRAPRIRVKTPPVDIGRVPLPRGVRSWIRKLKRAGTFDLEPSET